MEWLSTLVTGVNGLASALTGGLVPVWVDGRIVSGEEAGVVESAKQGVENIGSDVRNGASTVGGVIGGVADGVVSGVVGGVVSKLTLPTLLIAGLAAWLYFSPKGLSR